MSGTVGIVLVNYNGMKFMPECLESLSGVDYPYVEIIVVDNASTDGSVDWLEQHYPHVALRCETVNRGITGGNNAGINWCREKKVDFVLLLNNDTVVEPDFLSRLMVEAEDKCLLVPKIYFHEDRTLINNHLGSYDYWCGLHRDWFYGKPDSPESQNVRFATMANTCALLIPMEAFDRVGLMDDIYFMYSDDTDFITRAVNEGYRIKFVPSAVLYHKESSSSGGRASPLNVYYSTRNRLYFMFKHQKNPLALAWFVLYFSVTRILVAAKYLWRGQRVQLRALRNAISDFRAARMGYAPLARFQ